MNIIRWW